MKKFVIAAVLVALPSCALFTRQNARTALDAAQVACVFQSSISDSTELANACAIAKELIPLLRDLVAQREGARRAGVVWRGSADGGDLPDSGHVR